MATLYVHVGMAKCASTTLHDAFQRQPHAMVRATGFNALTPLVDHAMLFATGGRATALTPRTPAEVRRQFARWQRTMREHAATGGPGDRIAFLNECVTGVYPRHLRSTAAGWFGPEMLGTFRLEAAEALLEVAPRARILILVRDPRTWLRSMVNNLLSMGLVTSTEDFRERHYPVLRAWYAMDEVLPLYTGLFGDQQVTVLPIELARTDPARFVALLSEHHGFDFHWSGPARNQSLPGGALRGLQDLYALVDELSPATGSWSDSNTRVKSALSEFLLEAVRNDPSALETLRERYGDADPAPFLDETLLDGMWAANQCLRTVFTDLGLPSTGPGP